MTQTRRTSFYFGLWFIGTSAFSIPAALLYGPVVDDADYILGSGAGNRIAVGALLEILLAIANVATAVVLYRIARRIHESIALGYVALRIMESAIIFVGLISLLSVVTLRESLQVRAQTPTPSASPANRSSPSTTGRPSWARSFVLGSGTASCWAI